MTLDKDKIKVIIFDWGGTCCSDGEPFASQALQNSLKMNPDQIAAAVPDIYFDYYKGKYNSETFWRAIMSHFCLRETTEINPAALSQAYLSSYKIYPEVLDIAKKLKLKSYKVALLSNLTPEMRDYIRPLHRTADYFSPEIYSCDQGISAVKPDEAPYRIILGQLKVSPSVCLFIDNSQKNLAPAKQMGMQVIFFENSQQFIKDVEPLLI